MPIPVKYCLNCKQNKEFHFFNKSKRNKDGLQGSCRDCSKKYYVLTKKRRLFLSNENYHKNKPQKLRKEKERLRNPESKEKRAKRIRIRRIERRKQEPLYVLRIALRDRIRHAIKNGQKSGSAVRDLGCPVKEFKTYLESLFEPGMNWDNYGKWHLDHIKPLSLFNLANRKEFIEACHWANIQPLWASDNFKKSDKYEEQI